MEPKLADTDSLDWSDKDLNALSEVAETDIQKAGALWKRYSGPDFKNLLEAVNENGETAASESKPGKKL